MTFLDIVFRLPKCIAYKLQRRSLIEILDRENGLKDLLEAEILALRWSDFPLEELIVGILLNFD
jgi:hypothetical protein